MRRAVVLLAFLSAGVPAFAGTWTDLWLTPDQQGQRMLESGDAGAAAKQFRDPRLRAYADLKAGNYDSAARQLEPLKDADSLYNRGNALARAGKLQEALAAYDAALARSPNDRDARHNRDLVQRELQRQREAQQNGQGGKGQSGGQNAQNGDGQNGGRGQNDGGEQNGKGRPGEGDQQGSAQADAQQRSAQHGGQQGGAGQQGSSQQGGDQKQNAGGTEGGNSSDEQRSAGQPRSPQQEQPNQGQGSQSGSGAGLTAQQTPNTHGNGQPQNSDAGQGNAGEAAHGAANTSGRDMAASGDDRDRQSEEERAAAARRDAEAAFQTDGAPRNRVAGSTSQPDENDKPTSEQALAREQWLRRIPEDPGELLRRKFMVEYMKRHRNSNQ